MGKGMVVVAGMLVILAGVGSAFADSIAWRQDAGSGYTAVNCDDTYTLRSYEADVPNGTSTTLVGQYSNTYKPGRLILVGWADLFTLVPRTQNGGNIVIDCATLLLTSNTTVTYAPSILMDRMTTPWLTGPAGTNQNNVERSYCNITNHTPWAGGGNISTLDWTTVGEVTTPFPQTWGASFTIVFTQLMQDVYDNQANDGFVLHSLDPNQGNLVVGSSEQGKDRGVGWEPSLNMTYHYESVPEPATLLLVGTGALGALGCLRRRRMR